LIPRAGRRLLAAWALAAAAGAAQAGVAWRYCEQLPEMGAAQQSRLLRFAAVVRERLEASGVQAALIARSGLDLDRFAVRYSHAGVLVKLGEPAAWQVRQLYYACDERRPRIFDQGVAGFIAGLRDPAAGHVSLLLLPPDAAAPVAEAARSNARALALLSPDYSANAYAFALRYQNCNQWVAELLASAWGEGVADRAAAQAWLRAEGFVPTAFAPAFPPLLWGSVFIPFLHHADHPPQELAAGRFLVTMPESIEAFVLRRHPQAQRVELCMAGARIVVREGGTPLPADCTPADGDRVLPLSDPAAS
jgi:hypothetical protein